MELKTKGYIMNEEQLNVLWAKFDKLEKKLKIKDDWYD